MKSGFPDGGVPDFYADTGIMSGRRSTTPMTTNSPQAPTNSPLTNMIGKRSHPAELQPPQQPYHQILQQQQLPIQMALRNVKPRVNYQQPSPISPLSPGDFSSISSDFSSTPLNLRYDMPNLRASPINSDFTPPANNLSSVDSMVENQKGQDLVFPVVESDQEMMLHLPDLVKHIFGDDVIDNGTDDAVSNVTADLSWSETILKLDLISRNPISPSPTSPSNSCCSTSASPLITCPEQSIIEAATAIEDGKPEVALEILNRLIHVSNVNGTSEQRLTSYMAYALRSCLNRLEISNSSSELNSDKHVISTIMLYEDLPCFKLGFMAANLAILESISDRPNQKLHVIDFDIGRGGQYLHLVQLLSSKYPAYLKISAISIDQFADDRLKSLGNGLKTFSGKKGVSLNFNAINLKVADLNRENLGIEDDEVVVVNFAFKLYRVPDESVSTENERDELLRRVKSLSPMVVTLVEHEKNTNTAGFVTRVKEEWGYNGALFDSLEMNQSKEESMESTKRLRVEKGLGRRMCNSIACEGRNRQERTEVFGKWRARMSMAGFNLKPMTSAVAESLRSKLTSGKRQYPGFSVKEEFQGISFGWKERTITVASSWR